MWKGVALKKEALVCLLTCLFVCLFVRFRNRKTSCVVNLGSDSPPTGPIVTSRESQAGLPFWGNSGLAPKGGVWGRGPALQTVPRQSPAPQGRLSLSQLPMAPCLVSRGWVSQDSCAGDRSREPGEGGPPRLRLPREEGEVQMPGCPLLCKLDEDFEGPGV